MSIQLTEAAFRKAEADVHSAASDLRRDRDAADRRVTGFLDRGWTGVAADSFVEAWGDWREAAGDVLDGLVAMEQLLAATRRDFVEQDDSSQQRLDAISARIVDRLG